ncbi:cysteine hydrolase family protein [Leptospira stimsonii]|uniref:Cysteine hydrolase n=1 Tax=Leptospira stimsonii TaxID=2202203 RepID=A0ABY2MZV6_9LEPT|nr:cysteine hydrolase family protein [Leptospira stimsonii]TGK17813.1 cysteine hydrolase [Leptospira stimsonii]TGM12655.1 cysteine hydrolase [Leptospira stimsonii]
MKKYVRTQIAFFLLLVWNCSPPTNLRVSAPPASGTTALLILDVQMDFFPGGKFELDGASKAASKGENVLHYFREKKLPVFHIQHVSTRKGATFFFPGTPGVEFHSSHTPIAGESVIVKHTVNPFLNTNLLKELQEKNVSRLVIFGMMTHMVVDSTVRAAFDLGYKDIVVISDASATRALKFESNSITAEQIQGAFLSALGYIFAKISTASEFLKEESDRNQ